jgi:hypothetical protein
MVRMESVVGTPSKFVMVEYQGWIERLAYRRWVSGKAGIVWGYVGEELGRDHIKEYRRRFRTSKRGVTKRLR